MDLLGLSHRLADVGIESEERTIKTVSATLQVSSVSIKRDSQEPKWCM